MWKKLKNVIRIRPKTPEKLQRLLEKIDHLHLESETASQISDIPDMFEDIHKEIFPSVRDRHLTKRQMDAIVMDKFTTDFKNTMTTVRRELRVNINFCKLILFEHIFQLGDGMVINEELSENILDRVKSSRKFAFKKDKEKINLTKPTLEDVEIDEEECSDNALEEILQNVKEEKKNERFFATYPGFNLFIHGKTQWLERPSIPWESMNECKIKCEKWLNEMCA